MALTAFEMWQNRQKTLAAHNKRAADAKVAIQARAKAQTAARKAASAARPTGMMPTMIATGPSSMFAPGGYSSSGSSGGVAIRPQAENYGDPAILQQLAGEYKTAMDEGKAANLERYDQLLSGYQGRYDRGLAAQDQQIQGYSDMARVGAAGAANLTGAYQTREASVLGGLAGLGDQAKKDANQAYNELLAKQKQDLVSRGLANTTIVGNTENANARERQDAINRINEQLQNQRVQAQMNLSGDTLQQQGRSLEFNQGLQRQILDAQAQRQAMDASLSADKLRVIENRSDTYPSMDQYANVMQQLGKAGYQPPGRAAPVQQPAMATGTPGGIYMGFNSQYMPKATNYDAWLAGVKAKYRPPNAA